MVSNRSEFNILTKILNENRDFVKNDLETCLTKGGILKPLNEHVTLGDIKGDKKAIWSVLVLYGLLTAERVSDQLYKLTVPNISNGLYIVKLLLLWKGRVLSPEQVAKGGYTTVPETLTSLQELHGLILKNILAEEAAKFSAAESKKTSTKSASSTLSSHAAIASALPATGVMPKTTPALALSETSSTPISSQSSVTERKIVDVVKKSSKPDDFGKTLSGLRGAFR